jgi:hypothetical protein
MTVFEVPAIVRGKVIEGDDVAIELPGGDELRTPDPHRVIESLPLRSGSQMRDLYDLSLAEIIEFLAGLGRHLNLDANEHLQRAFALSLKSSRLTAPVLRTVYETQLEHFFRPAVLREAADRRVGPYLDAWVDEVGVEERPVRIRAYGCRTVHVVAGNSPGVSAVTVTRNALTRGDAIIKSPSNDPLTAYAIARTMVDYAPDHPLTRHLSVLYWRGGDEVVERALYDSRAVDKVVAWGGGPLVASLSRTVGPGVELVILGPKHSASLIEGAALGSADAREDAARRLARDVGLFDQEGCVNSRVAYVDVTGVADPATTVGDLAERVWRAIQQLPETYSNPAERLPPALAEHLRMAELVGSPQVIGGATPAGGVVISASEREVDFADTLACRYVNLVPVRGFAEVIGRFTSETQTVGVYPDSLRVALRQDLALAGVQRIVDLGHAVNLFGNQTIPQDGIEVLRRLCRWVVDETGSEGAGTVARLSA